MPPVRVKLLGPAVATVADRSVAFLPDKRFLLLAYAAHRGDWVGREELAHLFWPTVPDGTARHRLRQLLKRVRQLRWVDGLETEPHRVRWAAPSDVGELRAALTGSRYADVVRIYGGPLLLGLDGAAPTEYGRWLELERRDLHDRWRAAILHHGRSLEADGCASEAAELYGRVRRHDPFDEEALAGQVRALLAAGEAGRARGTWRAFADTVRRELGVEPGPMPTGLVAAIDGTGRDRLEAHVPAKDAGTASAAARRFEVSPPGAAFVGREVELAEVAHLLERPECRLLTIVGPGGVGKSRLAARAGEELAPRYPGGVHHVAARRLGTGRDVLDAAAATLAPARRAGDGDALAAIRARERSERTLLVLDGFEHLAADPDPVGALLDAAPAVDLVVTSRHRLQGDTGWTLPLEGLRWPPTGCATVEEALAYDAVRLFVDLAGRRAPFAPGPGDLPHLVDICAAVRGLPLALELAAAWTRSLPLRAIAERIDGDLDFLAAGGGRDGARDGAGRSSVRAAFDHSWSLLSAAERDAFARLSVFPGRFTSAAAEIVAGARLPVIAALVDRSLLRPDGRGGYERHPLLRGYAQERLDERPDVAAELHERHARYVLAEAEAVRPHLDGPDEAAALRRLDVLDDDVGAAFDLFGERSDGAAAVRLCAALGRWWEVRGRAEEGLAQIERALALPTGRPRGAARAAALNTAGLLAWTRNEYARAEAAFEASLELRRSARDRRGAAATLNNLGALAAEQGDLGRARALHEESLAIKRDLGNLRGVALSLNNLGIVASKTGDHRSARASFEESLEAMRACGHHEGTVMALNNLGLESERDGDVLDALARFEEGLALARRLGVEVGVARLLNNLGRIRRRIGEEDAARDHIVEALSIRWRIGSRLGVADSLEELAGVDLDAGRVEHAAALLATAAALRDAVGSAPAPPRPHVAHDLATVREALGPYGFATAWGRGRAEPLDRTVERELATGGASRPPPAPARR